MSTFPLYATEGNCQTTFSTCRGGGAGASHMIKDGALGDAEAIFGMHIDVEKPSGSVALVPGPLLAAICFFEAKIEGVGGHAAVPFYY